MTSIANLHNAVIWIYWKFFIVRAETINQNSPRISLPSHPYYLFQLYIYSKLNANVRYMLVAIWSTSWKMRRFKISQRFSTGDVSQRPSLQITGGISETLVCLNVKGYSAIYTHINSTVSSDIAKTIGSISIWHRSKTFASGRYLIDVVLMVFVVWVAS